MVRLFKVSPPALNCCRTRLLSLLVRAFRHPKACCAIWPDSSITLGKGEHVPKAAMQLAERSFLKRQRLLLAAEQLSSTCTPEGQKHALAAARVQEGYSAPRCSWPFIAGFFDAEDCIQVHPSTGALRVSFSQNTVTVLRWIADFRQHEMGSTLSLWRHGATGASQLWVGRQHDVHVLLRRLLDNGLLTKRSSALVALSRGDTSCLDIRHGLSRLSGNQSKYLRSTPAGIKRAHRISALRQSASRYLSRGQLEKSGELCLEIEALKREHGLSNAFDTYRILQSDIRELLTQGAVLDDAKILEKGVHFRPRGAT